MYPFRFEPIYQNYVWGGTRIPAHFHRPQPKGDRFAESWELSDRKEGMSVVANGPWKGKSLGNLLAEFGKDLIGKDSSRFPLLIKIIDAKENLSIQVHPNEKTAPLFGGEPKSEMWIALDQSHIYAGLKKGATPETLQQENAEKWLHSFTLKKGDAIFIPAGRVHAICANSLLLEIQQNSNTTYRLYDWGRKGRELHLKEGLASIDWHDTKPALLTPQLLETEKSHRRERLLRSPFFTVERLAIFSSWHTPPHTFQILFCTEGEGRLGKEPLSAGMTYLIPAALESIAIQGRCAVIRIL